MKYPIRLLREIVLLKYLILNESNIKQNFKKGAKTINQEIIHVLQHFGSIVFHKKSYFIRQSSITDS